jgi:hypothetical protein
MRMIALVAVIAVASTACDDSPTGPTAQTPIDVRVRDTTDAKLGSPVPAPPFMGTLSGNFAASIWDGSRWVTLGSPNGITVELRTFAAAPGSTRTVHGEQGAPAGSYDRARLVLQGVTATIARGSVIGATTLTSDTTIRLGGSDQQVALSVPLSRFSLEDDPSVTRIVIFDLHSPQWLTSSAVQSGQVEDAALQAAVSASTLLEPR